MQRAFSLWVFLVFVLSCTSEPAHQVEEDHVQLSWFAPPAEVPTQETVDPYEGYETWCEDIYKTACYCENSSEIVCDDPIDKDTKEPKACPSSRTGRSQICLRPHWARRQGIDHHECTPQWLGPKKQAAQRESLELIIASVCKLPSWAQDLSEWGQENGYGSDPGKLCWHLPGSSKALPICKSGHFCNPDKLSQFMRIPPAREVAWDNESAHELDRDKAANRASYSRMSKVYEGSPHYTNADRWTQGYGWYGHNAALHTWIWDKNAPPEILCRQVESTEVHLRKLRGSFQKLYAKYGDSKKRTYTLDTGETVEVRGVTWYDLHRAASSGKLTYEQVIKTRKKIKGEWHKTGFVSRARSKRVNIDPFETVMWEWLGARIPTETQNEVAERIRQKILNHFNPGGDKTPKAIN